MAREGEMRNYWFYIDIYFREEWIRRKRGRGKRRKRMREGERMEREIVWVGFLDLDSRNQPSSAHLPVSRPNATSAPGLSGS